jgi:hypothetical protein
MKAPFNPATDVKSNVEKVAAAHWECKRRNAPFRATATRWLSDEAYRSELVEEDHRARCALWWMLTPDEACRLAKELIKRCRLIFDKQFNFGPVQCEFKPNQLKGPLSSRTLSDAFIVKPERGHKTVLSFDHNWLEAPFGFRSQFLIACSGTEDLHFLDGRELLMNLFDLAKRLMACSDAAEAHSLGRMLLGNLHELGGYDGKLVILKVEGIEYPPWRVKELLEQVRRAIPMIAGHREEKQSWYGTEENWRWFLEWESANQNVRKAANIYVKEKSPCTTKQKSIPARQRDARKTIKTHVQVINRWIKESYSIPRPG